MMIWWIQLAYVIQYTVDGFYSEKFESPSKCKADEKELWSYRGNNGPEHWGETYPMCNGKEQSPIEIKSRDAQRDEGLSKLYMRNYDVPLTSATVKNNGHTIQVTPLDGVDRTIFIRGENYSLIQFHFHWGDTYDRGSEHIVDRWQYSMEEKKRSKNAELDNLISLFPNVMYKDMETQLRNKLTLNNLLPENPASYYRYPGSLTTPNCAEGVTWSVLIRHLLVSQNQMKEFRKLYSATKSEATKDCKLSNNYRPVQPLNGRTVYVSKL